MALYRFFTLQEIKSEEGKHLATTSLNPDHGIYKGHFPGNPVVPGVCLLHILKSICSEIASKPVMLTTGNSIKYLQIINPNENATIHWEIMMNGSEKDSYQVQCSAFWKGKVCFKFVGGFR